jgi:hypothetical protein
MKLIISQKRISPIFGASDDLGSGGLAEHFDH